MIGTVTIRIEDENDELPTFDISSLQLTVTKNENGKRVIAQIQAFDRDLDPQNNHIVYCFNKTLSNNGSDQYFGIESNGTLWTNITSDVETNQTSFQLFIVAANTNETLCNLTTLPTQELRINVEVIDFNGKGPG